MSYAENASTGGRQEMYALAVSAFDALQEAELTDVLEVLHERVFEQPTGTLFEFEVVDGVRRWRYKPMLELVLRHAIDTAADRQLAPDHRRAAIEWALRMSGF